MAKVAGFSWLAFFESAGIPATHAASYADVFEDNRIRADMLGDLTKELLQELGVAVLGDVLAILKQAKNVLQSERAPLPAPMQVSAAPAAAATTTTTATTMAAAALKGAAAGANTAKAVNPGTTARAVSTAAAKAVTTAPAPSNTTNTTATPATLATPATTAAAAAAKATAATAATAAKAATTTTMTTAVVAVPPAVGKQVKAAAKQLPIVRKRKDDPGPSAGAFLALCIFVCLGFVCMCV